MSRCINNPLQLLHRNHDASKDRTRQTVREGLTRAICAAEPDQAADKIGEVARNIEEAMFAALADATPGARGGAAATRCGSRYKAKYRSLQFNLKDPKNAGLRGRLLRGELGAEQLVAMEAHEMANEEMGQVIRHVREASLTKLMVPEGALEAGSFVKKTHKGEEPLPMASLDQAVLAPEPPGQGDLKSAQPQTAVCDEPVWTGKVHVPEMGRVPTQARFVAASTGLRNSAMLRRLLPHNIHISGRIPATTAQEYVQQIWAGSSSRDVLLFSLSPVVLSASTAGKSMPATQQSAPTVPDLATYLLQNDRWAVVAHDPQRGIRDFYLAPVVDPARFAMPLPQQCTLPVLMGVLVVAKDGRAVTSPVQDLYDPHKPVYSHSQVPL